MNSERVKTNKQIGWYPKEYEASVTVRISSLKRLAQFHDDKEYFFHSIESRPKEWRLVLSFFDESLSIEVDRFQESPIEVLDGGCKVSFCKLGGPSVVEQECPKGPIMRHVGATCLKGHTLPLSARDDWNCGWQCDGREFRGGCRSGLSSYRGTERYGCRRCNYDLCSSCFTFKQGDYYEGIFKLEENIEIEEHEEDEVEIAFRAIYLASYSDEDISYCMLPTVERLSSKISMAYEELFNAGKASDVTFVVNGEEIKAHEAILSARIPFFDKMLNSGMVEAQTKRIKIDDTDPATFKQMLKYVYCGKLPEDLNDSAAKLLPLTDKFDLPELRDACLHWLEKGLSKENVCETLIAADLFRCAELKKKCLQRLNQWKSSVADESFEALVANPRLLVEVIRAGE